MQVKEEELLFLNKMGVSLSKQYPHPQMLLCLFLSATLCLYGDSYFIVNKKGWIKKVWLKNIDLKLELFLNKMGVSLSKRYPHPQMLLCLFLSATLCLYGDSYFITDTNLWIINVWIKKSNTNYSCFWTKWVFPFWNNIRTQNNGPYHKKLFGEIKILQLTHCVGFQKLKMLT